MRKIIIFLIMVLIILPAFSEEPDFIDGPVTGVKYNILKDTIVGNNGSIYVKNLYIKNSLNFYNMGRINGEIDITDGCNLVLENSGSISGKINVGNNSTLTQVIRSNSDISQLSTNNYRYSILINNSDNIKFSEILSISGGAGKLTLSNAYIYLDKSILVSPQIELIGENRLKLDSKYASDGTLLLSNVSGSGVVSVDIEGLDGLYTATTIRQDDNVYLSIDRETDYQKVLGKSRGIMINNLRISSHYNSLVQAMDRESSTAGLYELMRRSVLFNPINLIDPIKTFNNFETNNPNTFNDSAYNDFEALYISSSDGLGLYGGKMSFSTLIADQDVVLSVYAGKFENNNDINNFSGFLYGGNIRGYIKNDNLWLKSVVGATFASFGTDMIFDGDKVVYNPNGSSVYGTVDSGIKFDFLSDFYFSPFIGIGGDYQKVLHQSDSKISGRGGGMIGRNYEILGIKNDYQLFGILQTNNIQTFGARVNFWSIEDMAGANLSYSVNHDEYRTSQKISAELNFIF